MVCLGDSCPTNKPERRKQIRSAGFFTRGSHRAFRLRKISGVVKMALWMRDGLWGEILAGDVG